VGFLLLTAMVVWWQFSRIGGGVATPRWDELRWSYLMLLLLCLPIETLACGLRIWVIARVLEPGVRLSTCIKAEWAQVAVSTLTPTQSGGGPGQIYIMHREGTRIGTAVTIMLLSCLGTMIALLGVGLCAVLASGIDASSHVLRAALWTSTGIAAVMVLLAVPPPETFRVVSAVVGRPLRRLLGGPDAIPAGAAAHRTRAAPALVRMEQLARKLSHLLDTYRHDTGRFLRNGKAAFALVCGLSLTFVLSRALVAYFVVRFMGIDTSTFRHILEAQIVVLLVEFVAPTPGGAGVVEGASLALMAAIVPPGHAPHYNLLWRFSTLYLPALAGFVCLARSLFQDARDVVRPERSRRLDASAESTRADTAAALDPTRAGMARRSRRGA
jgi:uncharacterized membrane protein YbhN (UPF0104 family)